MFKSKRIVLCLLILLPGMFTSSMAARPPLFKYTENNHGIVSFDVSMPIDSTGYILQGKNLRGGPIKITDKGEYVTHLLAHENGSFTLPVVMNFKNKPLIKTNIQYNAIKFINPNGIDNFFVKVGTATREQKVSGLDPKILKDGNYTWQVPFFSVGKESNTVNHKSENFQFIQVGSTGGVASDNEMYTEKFYLYLQGNGNTAIAGHPQRASRSHEILSKAYTDQFTCYADGLWGAGGDDPYRTIQGDCRGSTTTFPGGPNLDYVYGTFKFPTVLTPWTATPEDHCVLDGKRHAGCTDVKIGSDMRFVAQKIRVPVQDNLSVFAEFGTLYRSFKTDNLRYQCKSNVYLKNILPSKDCLKKSYIPGGWSAPYFAVGFECYDKDGNRYTGRYIYIPVKENANRLTWNDSSDTQIYAISVSGANKLEDAKPSSKEIRKNFNEALNAISRIPALYEVIGKHLFVDILKKNKL
jgi:hypothetical protein